jgi:4-amino-4-deoxy-L-arabinose transferase-like glycosyltransferase
MFYALPCAFVAAWLDPPTRRALVSRSGLAALAAMLVVVAPNIAWNALNDFHTVAHTGDNVAGGGVRLDPLKGLEFVGSQFGIAWGVALAAAIARAFGYARDREHASADRILLAFSLPVLVPMALYAFVIRANPNWAAPALVSAMVLGAAILVRAGWRRLVALTIAAGVAVQLVLWAGDAAAWRVSSPLLPKLEPYARVLGWRAMAAEVEAARRAAGARTVATDRRAEAALFTYYLRESPASVVAWRGGEGVANQFELAAPLTAAAPGPVLLVTGCPATGRLERGYAEVRALGPRTIATGRTTTRTMHLFLLHGPRGEPPPIGPCA